MVSAGVLVAASRADAQEAQTGPPLQLVQPEGQSASPVVVTLRDALERASKNDAQFQSTAADAQIAREDRAQAKSALLPALSHTTQYLGTQGNGVLPTGRYVTNDGVHVYRSWAVLRPEISPNTCATAIPEHFGFTSVGRSSG